MNRADFLAAVAAGDIVAFTWGGKHHIVRKQNGSLSAACDGSKLYMGRPAMPAREVLQQKGRCANAACRLRFQRADAGKPDFTTELEFQDAVDADVDLYLATTPQAELDALVANADRRRR